MIGFDPYALFLLIVLPLVGAGVILVTPGGRVKAVRVVATGTALLTMLLSAYVFLAYDHSAGGIQFERVWQWLSMPGPWPLGDHAITLHLGIDGIAAPMVLLTGVVLFPGVLVSWNIGDRAKDFFVLYLLLLSGVFGVFVTLDMFFFFFFYELAVLPMYLLIGVWGSSSDVPDVQPRQGIRRDEADDLPGSRQRADLGRAASHIRRGWAGHVRSRCHPGGDVLRELPTGVLSVPDGRIRSSGGTVAVPHMVTGRTRGRADCG